MCEIYESKFDTSYGVDCCGNGCDCIIKYSGYFYQSKHRAYKMVKQVEKETPAGLNLI